MNGEILRLALALTLAGGVLATGAAKLPMGPSVIEHAPVTVIPEPMLEPLLVTAKKQPVVPPGQVDPSTFRYSKFNRARMISINFARATPGIEVPVSLTQYCLRGQTRRGRYVRPGIVAADPRLFPLARYLDVYMNDKYIGRYLVDDTGGDIVGPTLDIWTPSCREGRRFGRQWGKAIMVARDEEHIPHPAPVAIDEIRDLRAIGSLIAGLANRAP